MSATAIIPARWGSERFPGKMLADRTGVPLVIHTCNAARTSEMVSRVVIATDDRRIADAAAAASVECVMTGEHPNGTSRLAEAAGALGLSDDDLVVNVQGDEPEIEGGVIDACIRALLDTACDVGTVGSPWDQTDDPNDPNIVKVVRDTTGRALYFSRAPIPHSRATGGCDPGGALRHVGIYSYRHAFLKRYVGLTATPLEQLERLEQLRVLEHGYSIAIGVCRASHAGIDTPEQYDAFVARYSGS